MEEKSPPVIQWRNRIFVIGLTGGIASGKSTAARIFNNAGIKVVNADMLAKDVFEKKEIQMRLVKYFGNEILEGDAVSRRKVADRVFNNSENLTFLNSLIHPEVRKKFNDIKKNMNDNEILVYDVPLLFETNQDDEYDITLTISASEKTRMQRAKSRDGWSDAEFLMREKTQLPLAEKEKRSDVVINNDGSRAELEARVNEFIERIRESRQMELENRS